MDPPALVVSDPPHEDVDLDAVAELLGLDVESARLKVGFPAPEVLKAPGTDRASEVAASLAGAGLSVGVVTSDELAGAPWPSPASTIEFGESALRAVVRGEEVDVPYDAPVLGVYCKPPQDFAILRMDDERGTALGSETPGPQVAEAIEWLPILDLWLDGQGSVGRVSIVPELCGLDPGEMASVVAECERRFQAIRLDSRLEGVRPRQRFMGGQSDFDIDMRKNYSFGTLLLRQALDSISPELRDMPQYELGSRFAFLLHRSNGGSGP